MTFSTSAVAVCWCSASFVSVEQPRVLDRDHRLIGEGLQQRLLPARRTRPAAERATMTSPAAVLPQHRRIEKRRASEGSTRSRTGGDKSGSSLRSRMWCVRRSRMIRSVTLSRERGDIAPTSVGPGAAPRRHAHHVVAADRVDADFIRPEQPMACAEIASNTGAVSDTELAITLEHFGRRRLPFERPLGLLEQPRVLERNRRVEGEGSATARLLSP